MKPGIYCDMSAREYFADPAPEPSLSQSIAKILLDQSPAHARLAHPKLNPDYVFDEGDYDKRKAIGDAAHKFLLERGKHVAELGYEDFRTKAAREARDECRARGETPILEKHLGQAKELVASVKPRLHMPPGNAEAVLVWEEDGIWFRTMVDWLADGVVYDLKTTGRNAAPHAIPHLMEDAGWPIQAAMIERGLHHLMPLKKWKFRFVCIEQDQPFGMTINELGESAMHLGRRKVEYAARIWRECIRRGEWPAYPDGVHTVELPSWAEPKWLDREIADEAMKRRAALTFNPEVLLAG